MEQYPTVSVCMITYGHEKFIERAIKSVLMQQCTFPIELIIANDCSPDDTDAVIQNILLTDSRASIISYTRHERNIGMGPNCYFVLQKSKGKYIASCDGDDFWNDPTKLQKQVEFLESNPDYVISCHDTNLVNENGVKIKDSIFNDLQKNDYSKGKLISGAFIMPVTMCYRNVIRTLPPEIYSVINFDIFHISLLGHFGKSKFQDEIIPASYRQHSKGVTSMISDIEKNYQQKNTFWQIFKYYTRINLKEYAFVFHQRYRQTVLKLIKSKINEGAFLTASKLYFECVVKNTRYNLWKVSANLTLDILKFIKNK